MNNKAIFILIILIFLLCNAAKGQQCQNDSTGLIPISELGSGYFMGMQGGLYGNGQNFMPQQHMQHGITIASQVIPLDQQGNSDPNGSIGFISIGMSNAFIFFAGLSDSAFAFPSLNSKLSIVNCADGGYDIDAMLNPQNQYWAGVDQKLAQEGLTDQQVQVIWFMQAKHISGIPQGEGSEHIDIMEEKFLQVFQFLKLKYPNLKQIFCSGRDYGGYSNPGQGNPEPYSYYTNWAFRKLLERQINGDTNLTHYGNQPKVAWLAWADNVWADGKNTRSDGFNWICPQDVQSDGVHPNANGKAKIANLLFSFFSTDTTTIWFRQQSPVSLTEIQAHQLRFFPNPVEQTLYISNSEKNIDSFIISDHSGKLIITSDDNIIDVSMLTPGMYFISALSNDTTYKSAVFLKF